jgi:dTDP-D-glucose 4,6-dehydratase
LCQGISWDLESGKMGKLWEVGSSRSKCNLQILLSLVDTSNSENKSY